MPAQGIGDNQRVGDLTNTSGINLKNSVGKKEIVPMSIGAFLSLLQAGLLYANVFEF